MYLIEMPSGGARKAPWSFRFALTDNVQRAPHADDYHLKFGEDVGIVCDERLFEKKIVDDDVQAVFSDRCDGAPHTSQ
ncbi:uncharacterized protein METZ01_LOCUS27689 [marine metagenome]|uniref:Uncharacterized protein n=1 Tax=marine metagenome TaxID=408172 RepID=A0A381Q661_9ZZZZ